VFEFVTIELQIVCQKYENYYLFEIIDNNVILQQGERIRCLYFSGRAFVMVLYLGKIKKAN
jgi:hypothetical protein